MLLLRTAHLGEVSVTVWPDDLKRICAARDIHVFEQAAAAGSHRGAPRSLARAAARRTARRAGRLPAA